MRKFMRFPPRTLGFRLLLILAGGSMLLAAFAPRANATLIRFYDFEGTPTAPFRFNPESHTPAVEIGAATTLFIDNGTPGMQYTASFMSAAPPFNLNLPSDAGAHLVPPGFSDSAFSSLSVEIPLPSSQGIYDVTSSFAYASNGNASANVTPQISTNAGTTFTNVSGLVALATMPGGAITINVPSGTTTNINNLVQRLSFSNGQSNGSNLQFQLDNTQISGTIVPEPATVAGGLLGVLGLCWFQRKRLIRSVRLRRT